MVVEIVVNVVAAETNVAGRPTEEEIPTIIISQIKTKIIQIIVQIQSLTKRVREGHQMSQIAPAPSIGNTPGMLRTAVIP